MVEEKVYCRYEGENGQWHLEGSSVNWASRLNGAMRGEKWGEGKRETREEPGAKSPRASQEAKSPRASQEAKSPRESVSKMAELQRDHKLGEG